MTDDKPRLIEVAFPLKQTSLDSVHEKNVRHGHISTLHIWPARRPLAACRAALIATLLPDPGNDTDRKLLLEKMGGVVKTKNTFKNVGGRKIPVIQEYTEGGILHWGRENNPDMDFFRSEIKKAFGGRAPRVLDPFAGGGAIPLEAMRLGCETTAVDINPVAWFILKSTLEYPQRLAGQKRPLPQFAINSPKFMKEYLKTTGGSKKSKKKDEISVQQSMLEMPEEALDWHVRAWGHWVLERMHADLENFYPTIDGKTTVAYLWARTVTCKNCRATIPLLKTLWISKNNKKRIYLNMKQRTDSSGVDFDIVEEDVIGGNVAKYGVRDQQISRGTMSRSGAWCPVCGNSSTIAMTRADIQTDMKSQNTRKALGMQMTAVVVDGPKGKEYRLPHKNEIIAIQDATSSINETYKEVPFGLPEEIIHMDAKGSTWCIQYGFDTFEKLFTPRQLIALGTIVKHTRAAYAAMKEEKYPDDWIESIISYLSCSLNRLVDFANTGVQWKLGANTINHSLVRFAIPLSWDFAEGNPLSESAGGYRLCFERIASGLETYRLWDIGINKPVIHLGSATKDQGLNLDAIVTDPPYYDAIPYSNVMDFFYVWLRRTLYGLSSSFSSAFASPLCPKWDSNNNDGELVDDASRFEGDSTRSKAVYEDGMARSFRAAKDSLNDNGHMVVVFANKQPEAWETLVSAVIRSGFVVSGSWPIQTEQPSRMRSLGSSALASSVWIVCRKRAETAKPGWDYQVLEEMRARINERLRVFWDAGIRGPDFVWAATGPAMEAYSKHPIVKKADQPEATMTVSEFLKHVRRIVVDYVVGRVLSGEGDGQETEGMDDLTLYYLLHRHDFGLEEAPVGTSILYAQSCNLSDRDLIDRFDLLAHGKRNAALDGQDQQDNGEIESEDEIETETAGNTVRLKRWDQRTRKDLGINNGGRTAPLIDQVHRIMRLWKDADAQQVDTYIEDQRLRHNPLYFKLLQALIQLADHQPDERTLLESIMNHITATGAHPQMYQIRMPHDEEVIDG